MWTNFNANTFIDVIKKLLKCFNENYKDVYIFLRADFTDIHQNEYEVKHVMQQSDDITYNKIGKYVKHTMKNLESNGYQFSHNMLVKLMDKESSNEIFGINYAFFIDDISKRLDKNGLNRYWKDPFYFNHKILYITSQWFEYNRNKFDEWYKTIK